MINITLQRERVEKQKGVVVLPIAEYQKLVKRAVPEYYLSGSAARKLDTLVVSGLKEFAAGKTKRIKSLADLV